MCPLASFKSLLTSQFPDTLSKSTQSLDVAGSLACLFFTSTDLSPPNIAITHLFCLISVSPFLEYKIHDSRDFCPFDSLLWTCAPRKITGTHLVLNKHLLNEWCNTEILNLISQCLSTTFYHYCIFCLICSLKKNAVWKRENGLWIMVPSSLDTLWSLDMLFNLSNPRFIHLRGNDKGKTIRL